VEFLWEAVVLASVVDGRRVLNDVVEDKMNDVLDDISDLIWVKVPLVPFTLSTAILRKKCLPRSNVNCLKLFGLFALRIEFCLLYFFD
jgi:hypothetical protein